MQETRAPRAQRPQRPSVNGENYGFTRVAERYGLFPGDTFNLALGHFFFCLTEIQIPHWEAQTLQFPKQRAAESIAPRRVDKAQPLVPPQWTR